MFLYSTQLQESVDYAFVKNLILCQGQAGEHLIQDKKYSRIVGIYHLNYFIVPQTKI